MALLGATACLPINTWRHVFSFDVARASTCLVDRGKEASCGTTVAHPHEREAQRKPARVFQPLAFPVATRALGLRQTQVRYKRDSRLPRSKPRSCRALLTLSLSTPR